MKFLSPDTLSLGPAARHKADLVTVAEADIIRTRALVRNAAERIAPVWPLATFIACNPMQGFEGEPFETAAQQTESLFGGRAYMSLGYYRQRLAGGEIAEDALDRVLSEAVAAFPDEARPYREAAKGWLKALLTGDRAIAALTPDRAATLQQSSSYAAIETVLSDETLREQPLNPEIRGRIDAHVAKYCMSFFDQGLAGVDMPYRTRGLYGAWRRLARFDADMAPFELDRGFWDGLPERADQALTGALQGLHAHGAETEDILFRELAALPGWTGYMKRLGAAEPSHSAGSGAGYLMDYLAIRLLLVAAANKLDRYASAGTPVSQATDLPVTDERLAALDDLIRFADLDPTHLSAEDMMGLLAMAKFAAPIEQAALFLKASEETYRMPLLAELAKSLPAHEGGPAARPAAQAVFCIDVRSEPFRRALEAQGQFDTYGYAGFFGVPMRHQGLGDEAGTAKDLCPVLVSPKHTLADQPLRERVSEAHRVLMARERNGRMKALYGDLKSSTVTPFALAEATGLFSGIAMAARTLWPRLGAKVLEGLTQKRHAAHVCEPRLQFGVSAENPEHVHGLSLEEQTFYAQALLEVTGLKAPFGRLLLLCAHGSTTTNNAYASALDCGACGGNHGAPNARVMAAILNAPDVRERLKAVGHELPDDMLALAGEHDTTTDEVTLFDTARVPASHKADLSALQEALAEAGRTNASNRLAALSAGLETSRQTVDDLSADWAQIRPEWGLAGNAAFLVGPRSLSAALDLHGRAFLHSYDWRSDPNGGALTIILTAPMVVAQWINSQYYFSTVDNEAFGSGTKVTQNVAGGIGVVQGNAGDLARGLPRQSVYRDDGTPYHEPLRLMTVVVAPRARVGKVVAENAILKRLFDNEWVALAVLDPETGQASRYRPGLRWDGLDLAGTKPMAEFFISLSA